MRNALFYRFKSSGKLSSSFSSSSYNTKEADLLQRSIVPTRHFQKSLPSLPIPKLEDTLPRYEASQTPLRDPHSLTQTKHHIETFLKDEGPRLHAQLLEFQKKNKHTNYVNIIWTDKYLKDRQPVVLTHNPSMIFRRTKHNCGSSTQLIRAANMIYSSVRFSRSLKLDLLEPLIYHINKNKTDTDSFRKWIRFVPPSLSWYAAYFFKAFPLDMGQLRFLINSTRIPKIGKDEVVKFDNGNHILVLHNGQMYTFDIFKDDGRGVEPKQILSNLKYILNQPINSNQKNGDIGSLTTMNRDKWSKYRQDLIQLGNEESLKKIDSAVFVVALDNCSYDTDQELFLNTLHGPAANRWFDKSFSLIIDAKGDAALNFEHSWGDGIAVLTYFEEIHKDSENNPQFSKPLSSLEESQLPSPNVTKIEFTLNKEFIEQILPLAKKEYEHRCSLLKYDFGTTDIINKEYLESTKLDSDALIQLAFQMAYYKLNGKLASTYESASTSGFKDGRTETLRPVTIESKSFCELSHNSSNSNSVVYEALSKTSAKHCKLKFEALMGKGWDRHLMGLKYFVAENEKVPEIFSDPNYDDINRIIVSTSTVPSDSLETGGFAAVTLDGYGVGYGIRDNGCGALITTWRNSSSSKGSQFLDALKESLKQLRNIIDLEKKSEK